MNTHDHDHDELPGEDELKALYRSLPRKEPSSALDHAVRRAAADAVRASRRRPFTRWPVAVASAAMVVVAAGLGWRMTQQPTSVPQVPTHAITTSAQPSMDAPMQAPAATPRVASAASTLMTLSQANGPTPVLAKRESIRSAMKPKVVASTVVPEQAPVVATEPALMSAPNEETADALATPPAPPAPAAPPAAPLADAAGAASARAPVAARAANTSSFRAPVAMQAASAPMPAVDANAFNRADTPSQELEKIRRLLALQRRDEAMQRLTAFQQAHPDIPLPDDLRAQLSDHE